MSARRPAHKLAHAQCPNAAANWADCDVAASHRWGRCVAEVEHKGSSEPGECSRWAQDDGGYCTQHFIARHEKDMEAARRAERTLQLNASIDAHIARVAAHPSIWPTNLRTSAESTRGLLGIDVAPAVAAPVRVRRLPFRLPD